MKGWKVLIIGLVIFNLFLSLRWLLDGNLLFHNDIARDFYLMRDIWENKHLTLIGARAGGLNGWFHGPLWLYINLPAYILGKGNPLVIGWFWFGLHLFTCTVVFLVAKKIFDEKIAYISLLIYSAVTILDVHGYINPQGALIVFPIFFYFYWKYKKRHRPLDLVMSLFLVGLMIQFQIAFGAPILILTIIDNIIATIKDKKISRFLAYFILIIPLSTYIVFELRHNFLQIKSIQNLGNGNRIDFIEKIKSIPIFLYLSIFLLFLKKKNIALNLFLFFYIGFWFIALAFNGKMVSYYYSPFLPIIIIIVISLISKLNNYLLVLIVSLCLIFNWQKAISDNLKYLVDVNHQDWSTWKSIKSAGDWAIKKCGENAGIFVYTADLYGYNLSYSLINSGLIMNQKKEITCLLMGPNVKENPYGSDNWKSGDIKITGKLIDSMEYKNGIKIEKYQLSEKDIQISPNPFLIKDIFFR